MMQMQEHEYVEGDFALENFLLSGCLRRRLPQRGHTTGPLNTLLTASNYTKAPS